jgi:UDP-N-acetylglucosamine--N-acetylmuramyl-(pentapeptide) pyrophosphoryl-undecaprenol N-acetylglucosamine transferase
LTTRGTGLRLLAVASSGGHFKQLVRLVPRIRDVGSVTWVTYDTGLAEDLLRLAGRADEALHFVPYAAPRDLPNLGRDAVAVRRILRTQPHDLAVSTGAGIAAAVLPTTKAMGMRSVFIESATRVSGPSLSGRILQRIPGLELYSQHPGYGGFGRGWKVLGSVHDEFAPGDRGPARPIRRVVVTLGTIRPYGFRRLLKRLLAVLPPDVEVLWQTGATEVGDLPLRGHESIPGPDLEAAIEASDVVIAHAGTGTALTAFECGRCPILVPRRTAHGEHVDDHQVGTAIALAARGLAVHAEVEEVTLDVLQIAASRRVVRRTEVPMLPL